jgi:hypothetical protein
MNQTLAVNGENIPDHREDENRGDQELDGEQPIFPQDLFQSAREIVSISEKIDLTVSTTPMEPGGFMPGIPKERTGGGGGNGGGDDDGDDNGEEQLPIFDAIVRVVPDPVPSPGIEVQVIGITNASSSTYAIFELFGPDCPFETKIPCARESDLSQLSPPDFSGAAEIPSLCSNSCEQYSVVFPGEHLGVRGEYLAKATFFDSNDNIVAIKDMNFRVHSFFVIPESQFGAIALILASFGTLIIVYYLKLRPPYRIN